MIRTGFIGGSDAKRIVDGDWHTLYLEKVGLKPPEDLTANFQVQLGIYTEKFHIAWLNKFHGFDIRAGKSGMAMLEHPMIKANIDGWCHTNQCFIDVKHSNGRASRDSMIDWYLPQITHYCNVTGLDTGILSYIAGNALPDWFRITPGAAYQAELLKMELAFWWHVENEVPPDQLPDAAAAMKKIAASELKIDDMRTVSMEGNNNWAALAVDYLLNVGSAAVFEKAKKGLKELVEADVRLAHGHGLMVKRSKSGSLLFTEGRP